ncbi:MAG: manganese ABC transporter permease [Chloroflexi bacterium]|nr:manganese ABC transporter permease [Chloroflexota bacterium]|tara:strand:+ start:204 stop:1028 length:825 start_codon:yes stop_codon:yes gene_type:complete
MFYDLLVEPLTYNFFLQATFVCILIGIVCPLLGAFVINRELGFMGDAMAHSVLPGMIIAYSIGVNAFLGAIPNAIAIALLIGFLVRRFKISTDTSIGIMFSFLFSIGLIIMSVIGGTRFNLEEILIGQVLSVSNLDLIITSILSVAVITITLIFYRPLVYVGFDYYGAKVSGIPSQKLDYLLLVLLSIVIVISLQVVGIILVVGLLITPAATASLMIKRFKSVIILGIIIGIASSIIGLYFSYHLDLPSGPTICVVSTMIFSIALLKSVILKIK